MEITNVIIKNRKVEFKRFSEHIVSKQVVDGKVQLGLYVQVGNRIGPADSPFACRIAF